MSEKKPNDLPTLAQDDRPVWERIVELSEKIPQEMLDQWKDSDPLTLALAEIERLRKALEVEQIVQDYECGKTEVYAAATVLLQRYGYTMADGNLRVWANMMRRDALAALTPPAKEVPND